MKGWHSCQGTGENVRNREMLETTGFERSSIDYTNFFKQTLGT